MFVLTMVLVLSISVIAVLSMSLNSGVVATKLEDATRGQHRADGALEEAVNQIRNDTTICANAPLAIPIDSIMFDVACDPASSSEPSTRIYDLTAVKRSDSSVGGVARVKVIDWPSLGYKLEVCDWLLGVAVSGPLDSCSTAAVTP